MVKKSSNVGLWFKGIVKSLAEHERRELEHQELVSLIDAEPEETHSRYWTNRFEAIPDNWVCPICKRVKERTRSWVVKIDDTAVCKSCFMAPEGSEEIPEFEFYTEGPTYHWRPDISWTLSMYASLFEVSKTTVWRWKQRGRIPERRAESLMEDGRGGEVLGVCPTRWYISQIREYPKVLGISGRAFSEILGFTGWRTKPLGETSWKRFCRFIAEAGTNQ